MEKRKDVNLVLFCENCDSPNSMSIQIESILHLLGFYKCHKCQHRHYELQDLINYSKGTRGYS